MIRRAGACLLVTVGMVLWAFQVSAQAAADNEQIYQELGVDQIAAADYVILVDVSGSMQENNLYDAVKRSLRGLIAALAPQDTVTLIAFADRAVTVWQAPVGHSPDAVVAKLPTVANGAHTDIGMALEEAVKVLNRPTAAPIATVIMLTDGRHEPKFGSPYPLSSGYAWNQLRDSATALPTESLTAYAVPLANNTSAGLLTKVFGPAASVLRTATVDQLTDRLAAPKRAVRAAKAKRLIKDDLSGGIAVEWPAQAIQVSPGSSSIPVTLRATTAHLPLTISSLRVRGCPGTRLGTATESIDVPPGGAATVAVTIDWDAGPRNWRPFDRTTRQCPLRLTGTVSSPWSAFITSELKATLAPTLSGTETRATLVAQRGRPGWWSAGLAVLLALFGLGLALRWHRLRPPLFGALVTTVASGAGASGADTGGTLRLRGRRMPLSADTAHIPGVGWVRASRGGLRSPEVLLEITYSPNGSTQARELRRCGARKSVEIGPVRFEWRVEGP